LAAPDRLGGLACFASFEVFLVMIVSLNHKEARGAPFAMVVDMYYGVVRKSSWDHPRLIRGFDPELAGP
jgi:hypothetical protein